MTDDHRDPIRAAFEDYRRAPRDVVPRTPLPVDDIPTGTAEVVYYEMTGDGIERITERIHVTTPYTGRLDDD
ncbi:hypothetical protein [Nocardia farcinica]|uniref:hypothetical protein n=1 Tax=Nocardia farcinica TaxID=37329 RepID=UPI000A3828CC|nr:hypothetical protein [Nocardia farcinica]MBA4855774.1 hypothetical protein [Nocardia farcinica]MBC9815740.1 hypothetical protein [Nocardia farcinica]MBF6407475.1 hypothetical protein [Nocardia farcinica]